MSLIFSDTVKRYVFFQILLAFIEYFDWRRPQLDLELHTPELRDIIYFSFKRLIKLNGTSIFGSLSDKLLHAFGPLHSSHAYFFLQCARLVPLLSAPARFLFWLCALMTNCMRLSWSVPDLDFLARFCASCAWAGGEIGGVSTVRWQQRQRFFGGSSF